MADVQMDLQEQQNAQPVAVRGVPLAVWVLIGLLALVMAVTTGLAVATIIDDSTPAPEQVKVPMPVAVDVTAAKAMKDEAKAAVAVGQAYAPATVNPGETKIDAANHALSMRSLGLQKQLETTDLAERLTAAESSGTAAKDEAGVAAAIGNSSP
jgi:hypothetical protein